MKNVRQLRPISCLVFLILGFSTVVFAQQEPVSLKISPDDVELKQREATLLKAFLIYADGSTQEVAADWYISDKKGCEVAFYLPLENEVLDNFKSNFVYEVFGRSVVGVTVLQENQGKERGWAIVVAKFGTFTASVKVVDAATLISVWGPPNATMNNSGSYPMPWWGWEGPDNDGYSVPVPMWGQYNDGTWGGVVLSSASISDPSVVSIKVYNVYTMCKYGLLWQNLELGLKYYGWAPADIFWESNGLYYGVLERGPYTSLPSLPGPDYKWTTGSGIGYRLLSPGTATLTWKVGTFSGTCIFVNQ